MKRPLFAPVLFAALLGLARPAPSPASDTASIFQTLAVMKDHTILFVAATEAKEVATLRADGPVTLFAPTDAAFKSLDDAAIKKIAADKDTVRKLFQSHLVNGKLTEEDLQKLDGKEIRTIQGTALKIENGKDGLRVNGAKVLASIPCSNGVIHVIDAVLPVPKG
jgi:uncharacterized surface protein with fasciclin (FAS1) repeats